jgi:hypothetical protein
MNDFTYPCKDCLQRFTTAKAFVDHVAFCVPVADRDALLQNAVMLLRRWVHAHGLELQGVNARLATQTMDFLKTNKLQGSVLR